MNLIKYHCKQCGHSWLPRTQNPKQCPACGSHDWNEKPTILECKKCGHSWRFRGNSHSREVIRCPGCLKYIAFDKAIIKKEKEETEIETTKGLDSLSPTEKESENDNKS